MQWVLSIRNSFLLLCSIYFSVSGKWQRPRAWSEPGLACSSATLPSTRRRLCCYLRTGLARFECSGVRPSLVSSLVQRLLLGRRRNGIEFSLPPNLLLLLLQLPHFVKSLEKRLYAGNVSCSFISLGVCSAVNTGRCIPIVFHFL